MSDNKYSNNPKSVITTPIFCTKTQMVYEKAEIEKAIEVTGQCPETGIEITKDDLIEIKQPPLIIEDAQRDISFNDILSRIKAEYDLLIYEKFALTNELNQIRLDLNDKLCKNEAAAMVIARLIKERDEEVDLLNEYKVRLNDN